MKVEDCPHCDDPALAALADAVAADDIDRAIALGLLDFMPPAAACARCVPRLGAILIARDARLRALAARERYRARQMRLTERAELRARRRAAAVTPAPVAAPPTLPAAAAAVLARAKAKAAAGKAD
ncbi:hypothetical protein [Lysobacter hankyongensis]|uniref:Uncharacterized protein n=1 Tax=Lysobacter hankyongensis TaxID=1176535 RepID=A0ABP9BX22_9GAMM